MTYRVCYWDSVTQSQQERDCTPAEIAEIESRITQATVVPVPAKVTRRQARQALVLANKYDLVQPAIDAISDTLQRKLMQIEWDDSQEFERDRPSLVAIGAAIGLTPEGVDDLFRTAATL